MFVEALLHSGPMAKDHHYIPTRKANMVIAPTAIPRGAGRGGKIDVFLSHGCQEWLAWVLRPPQLSDPGLSP